MAAYNKKLKLNKNFFQKQLLMLTIVARIRIEKFLTDKKNRAHAHNRINGYSTIRSKSKYCYNEPVKVNNSKYK